MKDKMREWIDCGKLGKIVIYLKDIIVCTDVPGDCNNPKVLKTYLKGCRKSAEKALKLIEPP